MSGYIGAQPVPQATQHREAFTATASQTSFATVGYTPQFVDVYLNGVKLAAADYTATNGSDIVLATGAALNDILEYVAYTPFEVADQTFTGTTTTDVLTTTGRLTLPTNTYHYSSDGKARLYYYDNGDTLFRTADDFLFRNNTNTTIAQLSDTGLLTVTGNIATAGSVTATGGVYLGGTGSANKLDDYEEGSYTATLTPSSSGTLSLVSTFNELAYTKVGRNVHIQGFVQISGSSSPVGNDVKLNLPFTTITLLDGSDRAGSPISFYDTSVAAFSVVPLRFLTSGASVATIRVNASTVATGDGFYIAFTYITS